MSPARALALAAVLLAPLSAQGSAVAATAPRPSSTTTTAASPRRATPTTTTTTTTTVPRKATTRRVTYSIATKGVVSTDVEQFARQVAETLADGRGWARAGIVFERVAKGGQFTLWLSAAGKVPTFGKPCDATYSCRAGRNVVINDERWRTGTPSWTKVGASLREYRNLVVNHEVGHWLGRGHARCSKAGGVAPVMQQQSKSLGGCVANAWPLDTEIARVRRV